MNENINLLYKYPIPDEKYVDTKLNSEIIKDKRKIIVLDDDPTGVQTVHDVSVFTEWKEEDIYSGFLENNKLFYILTNSRGMTSEQSIKVHKEICANISKVSDKVGRDYIIISRSDSTLRGHYPLETELLRSEWEKLSQKKMDGEILCPFFKEGGRYTINNIHYVRYGNDLVPAGETEFAKDKTFGYLSSDLCEYIEEKTEGKYKAKDVIYITLDRLRNLQLDEIEKQLLEVEDFRKVIVNAVDYVDIKVFCTALYRAMQKGKNYIFRSAASFVKVMGGISEKPLLTKDELFISEDKNNGGIIVVGSYTKKTTEQLNALKEVENLEFIEFNSDLVLKEDDFQSEILKTLSLEEAAIRNGKTAVVYTKRSLLVLDNDTKEKALQRSVKISNAVQSLVGNLNVTPAFVVAKGGITSSDIGTRALKVKKATVLGQISPGIPVWKTGNESRFPSIPYIIFPGNVGSKETLKEVVYKLL